MNDRIKNAMLSSSYFGALVGFFVGGVFAEVQSLHSMNPFISFAIYGALVALIATTHLMALANLERIKKEATPQTN